MFEQLRVYLKKSREFRTNATLTRAEFEAKKLIKFRELAQFANAHSPYYARLIREHNIQLATCVPEDFPVLTKSLLMANFDEIVTDPRLSKQVVADFLTHSKTPAERLLNRFTVIHTSGSSGEVGYFVYSPEDMARAIGRRQQRPALTGKRQHRGRFRIAFYGATDGHYAAVTMISMMQRGLLRLFVKLQLLEVNSPLPEVLQTLNDFQPELVIGYTTALKILAEKQRAGLLHIRPRLIATGGEGASPNDKAMLTEAFGCGVMSTYACSEHLGMGTAAAGSDQIVLYDDDLIFEFQTDHCLITNLFNRTLPLLRYRMSDTLQPVAHHQHQPYLVIESLVGRNELQPVFINRDGVEDFISPHTINEVFVKGLNRFQLHMLSATSFRFMVCLDAQLTPAEREQCCAGVKQRLQEILARKRMENVQFTLVVTDDLPVNPVTRKFQLIVDKRAEATG
jgi:phenylacetate-coenzyme A ligase PaaK-like adenylate-forming protein